MATPSCRKTHILYAVLPDLVKYLNVDSVIMYMIAGGTINEDDHERLSKLREPGSKMRLCTDLVIILVKKKAMDSFILAVEQSAMENASHDDILRRIREEREKEDSLPSLEPAIKDERDRPLTPIPIRVSDDEREEIQTAKAPKDEDGNNDDKEPSIDTAFCLGNLCTGMIAIVLLLAASGIALIYFAAQGWMIPERVNCTIKLSLPPEQADNPDPEQTSIYAFLLLSGFLCLIVPTIFLLLLVCNILKRFKCFRSGKVFQKVFILSIIAYIAVCILIGLTQVALSFYIASLIYPNFRNYMFDSMPNRGVFECDSTIYLCAFISVTITYVLIFVLLSVFVGWYIATKVKEYFATIDGHFENCFQQLFMRLNPSRLVSVSTEDISPPARVDETDDGGEAGIPPTRRESQF